MGENRSEALCKEDCLNCIHPDCINDHISIRDYRALDEIERELLFPKTHKQRKVAAQKRAYRAANRTRVVEQKRCIRDARKAAGYTQTQVAKRLGVTQGLISQWESGTAPADWLLLREVFPELKTPPTGE